MDLNAQLSGTGVALVTPFTAMGAIDYVALQKLIEHVIDGGVDFLVALGTTGEAVNLTTRECRAVFDFIIRVTDGRKPIVAGLFGHNFTEKLREGIANYDFSGMSAIMSSSPAYIKPSQEGIYAHYMRIGELAPLPIIIYNVPGRTGSNVEASTTLRLANQGDRFIAVKEAAGSLEQVMHILRGCPPHFRVLSGDDVLTLPLIACGGHGVISVIANAYPEHFSEMVRSARSGDLVAARRWNESLLPVHTHLYAEGNPTGIKAALELLNVCERHTRIPITPMSEAGVLKLREAMEGVAALSATSVG